MQVTEVTNEGLKRAYTVLVPAGTIAAERERRLATLGRDLKLPGFRPGKVPAKVVQQRYGQAVMTEVLDAQVNQATQQVMTDRGLRPALDPKVELGEFAPEGDLSFTLELEVLPEVAVPDLGAITVERLRAEPDDAAVEAELARLARSRTQFEDIAEARPATAEDVAVCDFTGRRVNADGTAGEAFPGGSATDMPIELGGGDFIPGFVDGVIGIAPGETREVRVTFPERYQQADLAGQPAVFEVTCKALKRAVPPVLDDAFATGLGLPDLAALRGAVRENLQRELDRAARTGVKRKLLDALAANATFPVPEGLVEAEFAQIWPQVETAIKDGKLDGDDAGKDETTLRAEYRAIAERRIRLGLLLSEIGRTNNVRVTDEELAKAMREQAMRYPQQAQQLMEFYRKNPQAADQLRSPLFEEKVVDFLLELAKVEERVVSPEELRAALA